MHHERPLLSLLVVLSAAAIAVMAALAWPEGAIDLMREDGPVENLTVVIYLMGLAAAWSARHPAFDRRSAAAVSVLLIACVAREVSLRRQLLTVAGYGESTTAMSAWPNLLAAAITVALVPAVLWLAWRYARSALASLARRKPMAVTLLVAFVCIVAAEAFDHILKVTAAAAGEATLRSRAVAFSLEETLELMFPVVLFIAAYQSGARWRLPWGRDA